MSYAQRGGAPQPQPQAQARPGWTPPATGRLGQNPIWLGGNAQAPGPRPVQPQQALPGQQPAASSPMGGALRGWGAQSQIPALRGRNTQVAQIPALRGRNTQVAQIPALRGGGGAMQQASQQQQTPGQPPQQAGFQPGAAQYAQALRQAPGQQGQPGATPQGPAYGEPGWKNPNYKKGGYDNYRRYDWKDPGAGLERAEDYGQGAWIYDKYAAMKPGDEGYKNAQAAVSYGKEKYGDNLSDFQKFDSMNAAMAGGQRKNQRPKRKFGLKQLLGKILPIAGGFFGPLGAMAGSAVGSAVGGGSIGDIAFSGAKGYVGNKYF